MLYNYIYWIVNNELSGVFYLFNFQQKYKELYICIFFFHLIISADRRSYFFLYIFYVKLKPNESFLKLSKNFILQYVETITRRDYFKSDAFYLEHIVFLLLFSFIECYCDSNCKLFFLKSLFTFQCCWICLCIKYCKIYLLM